MSNGPDWGACVVSGQAKAIGVSWNEAELKARYEYNIPADFVRNGILTPEQYKQAQEDLKEGKENIGGGTAPKHRYWKKEQLVEEAKAKGHQFDESAITRTELILMIES